MQILGSLWVLGQERGVRVRLPETLTLLPLPEIAWKHETPPCPRTGEEKKKEESEQNKTACGMLSESEQWPFFAFRGFYHRTSCESNRCEPAVEPRQVFSACSVPPDARDSGKLLASPPSATTQASFGRVKESTTGMTWETPNGESIATPSFFCREGVGEHTVLMMPSSWQGRPGISLLGKVAAWLQSYPTMAKSILCNPPATSSGW